MKLEDLIERDLTLTVELPEGQERSVTVRGSEPVMDLLVTLCARYHLNPSDHLMELFSTNQNHIKFKPSSLIGCLEAERVVLKPKRCADSKRVPNVPVATVRLIINYRKSHKAVVRVNPRVPLAELMPVVCEKCELNPDTTLLLRDSQSNEPLDLSKTLNDYSLRDVYAKDMEAVSKDPATATHKEHKLVTPEKGRVEKENRGLLRLFRRSKKTADERASVNSAPSSPVLSSRVSAGCLNANSSSSTPPSDMPKKRRAPQPPIVAGSQSIPCGLSLSQNANGPRDAASNKKGGLSGISSTESSLKRTKRKAPPPPGISPSPSDSGDKEDAKEALLNVTSFDRYCDLPQSVQSSPLMTEILSEFMDRMNAQEEKSLSSEGSVSHPHQTLSHSPKLHAPLSGFLEPDPTGQSTCLLRNHAYQKDGLTTFTVVPQRKRHSLHQYEFIVTLESLGSLNQNNESRQHCEGEDEALENSVQKKVQNPELGNARVATEEVNEELTASELAVETVMELNRNGDAFQHPLDKGKMENGKDWVTEFRQKRRIFESDDEKPMKSHSQSKWFHRALMVDQMEAMMDDLPTPPLPVCWEEDLDGLHSEKSDTTLDLPKTKQMDEREPPTIYTKPSPVPTNNGNHLTDPQWDVNLSLSLFLDDSDVQHPPDSSKPRSDLNRAFDNFQAISPTQANGHTLSHIQEVDVSKPKVQTSVEQPSPSSLSLFALAVSRRAQTLRQKAYPLML